MIKIEKLSKCFNGNLALENINLAIKPNTTTVIIGPSGGGKSTLLRCLNLLESFSKGKIHIANKDINEYSPKDIAKVVGMVFQQFHLFNHLSVLKNLTYAPCKVLKLEEKETQQRALHLLKDFKIKNKADVKPSQLSGGQKQRVAIARALMMDPEVVLFDEPTSALDEENIKDIAEVITKLKKKKTMVIVTHQINLARLVADRIVFMDHGQILADQEKEQFFTKPASQRAKLFLQNILIS